jgi:hypothetical protein
MATTLHHASTSDAKEPSYKDRQIIELEQESRQSPPRNIFAINMADHNESGVNSSP